MNKYPRKFIFLLISLLLSSCSGLIFSPTQQPQYLTHQPGSRPTLSADLDPDTEQALQRYPLWEGSSWAYEYLGFDQGIEVVWRIIDTVVNTRFVDGYYVAELERSVTLLDGNPSENFLTEPETGTFWYLIDGENLYRFEDIFHTDLESAWLDLVLPFPENNRAWYPHPDRRSFLRPGMTGFRYASNPFKKVLPWGDTYDCYNVATRFKDATAEGTFCEGVGYVYQEFNYYDRAYGYRVELIEFSLQ